MNESTCSSKFQTDLRKALPGCEVIKHADKSMIGMVDASVTFNKKTLWIEYKFIGPTTKGVSSAFMRDGVWNPSEVASASPTQADTARKLATAGHCVYLSWVLNHKALRKRVGYVTLWHPITGFTQSVDPQDTVALVCQIMKNHENLSVLESPVVPNVSIDF